MTQTRGPAMDKGRIRRNRLKLVAIISLFVGPLLIAFIWYYGLGGKFAPTGAVNNAPLISPVVTVGEFQNALHGGGAVGLDSLRRKWTLVHPVGDGCGEACETFLYHTRQTRIALGKDVERLQRYLIVTDPSLVERLRERHPDALFLESGGGLEVQLTPVTGETVAEPADAILIDPLGNAMMRIPADLDPKLMLKDLKKLLKLSRIG